MNIQQLRYFLVLADTLSFTKTAEKYYISQTAVSRYPLYVAVPPQHPFAEFHSLKREQLADEIFISYRQNALSEYDPTQAILADFADVGLMPNINFQHQAIESILLFVALGKGITIVPEYFLPCAPAGINLLFIPLEDSALPAEVAAIWQEKNTNPALDKFVECMQRVHHHS